MQNTSLIEKCRELADTIGIDTIGFAEAAAFRDYAWQTSRRRNPRLSMPDAKTIIVAGIYIGGLRLPVWQKPNYGRTSRLYLSGYFLDVVKPLRPMAALLKNEGYQAIVCDGSSKEGSILPLKLAAVRAGLGWQGKHSLLISKRFGTFLALGGIITNADIEPNTRVEPDRCRDCDKCQQACPLGALDQPHVLNMKRCMSYSLQSENLPEKVPAVMENRVADCEICQEACPWNARHIKKPLRTPLTIGFQKEMAAWKNFFYLPDLINLTESEYKNRLGHLNTDIPYQFFHRNVLIAGQWADKLQ
jgi:epoxyqueuosine reductase